MPENSPRPTLLLILDGWGEAPDSQGNAFYRADTPELDRLLAEWPSTSITCSGRAVGLPDGFMGNSEVGHMNLGAGRVIMQDMLRIDVAIEENTLADHEALADVIENTRQSGGTLHLMGLLSDGGVHSHIRHLEALLQICADAGVDVVVHAWMDGRDTPPRSGVSYMEQLMDIFQRTGAGRVGVISGRYYAMDRDKRWDRVELAYKALTQAEGERVTDPVQAVRDAYEAGENDEFIKPRVMVDADGEPQGVIKDGDGVFFFNFRADRARELSYAFNDPDFDGFERDKLPKLVGYATMTEYSADLTGLGVLAAFPPESFDEVLGEVVSELGLKQLRIAETEKYAHVTYFFNCGREEPFEGEDRIMVPSPREVATYDEKPEMSCAEVTDKLVEAWNSGQYSLVVCNLANLDMVGHTGIIPAAIKACEAVDACVGRLVRTVVESGGQAIVTADHGNAEEMLDIHGDVMTAHSTNPVPLVLVSPGSQGVALREGKLGDVAPTILDLWGVAKPEPMQGETLIVEGVESCRKTTNR
ncbi:2,3-bisphosphoglycerate-independent phosphoglycerate mutase [Oceanidesulfovibrio indonesiensis]|uniref:2,3-bisphosphoglycerate-independent phosphoglycerate mutase n=1 Tax=Oceanidesulfovibrio indonesiensis TaxID=54767 RepID=A0A7M3MCD6_9BACT|nr:2,3-bisphosphoglycerate-independent phosphoglycerate mutase [Oceanidesulfovibrio indonesiensis]TVM15977.1 2,3-bisphosphoglycerate-independent phosphoglycerate mutase [Oceanidesulfovibrio indonesiensis]